MGAKATEVAVIPWIPRTGRAPSPQRATRRSPPETGTSKKVGSVDTPATLPRAIRRLRRMSDAGGGETEAALRDTLELLEVRPDGDGWTGDTPTWFGDYLFGGWVI